MGSSLTPEPLVDTDGSGQPAGNEVHEDCTTRPSTSFDAGSPKTSAEHCDSVASLPRHSPVVLVIDVVRLLRGRGLAIVESTAYSGEALRASADLLRSMGVVPDDFVPRHVAKGGPELSAAATLMRAAGIEPNDVAVWPGARR